MEEIVKLGDGKEYTISTLDVGDLIAVDKKFGTTELNSARVEQVIYWVYLSLIKKHKDLKQEELYKIIDMPFISKGGIQKLFEALSRVNEWTVETKNEESPAEE